MYKANAFGGYFVESPDLRGLFPVFRNHETANILIDYSIFTEFRISRTVSTGCGFSI